MLTTLLGGRAFAERFGHGPVTVVALHGWGRSRLDFSAMLQGRDAIAVDLPGFGATPPPESGWTTAQYAAWVRELLADLAESDGGERPVLVGHSFGGRVAVHLGATAPEMLHGLVLTGVPLLRPQASRRKPALGFRVARRLNSWHVLSDERMDRTRRRRGSADYNAAQGVLREVLVNAVNEDYGDQLDALARCGLPVRMVWGEHDTAAPVAMAREARERAGVRTELTVVPGSAHLLDRGLVVALRSALDELAAGS